MPDQVSGRVRCVYGCRQPKANVEHDGQLSFLLDEEPIADGFVPFLLKQLEVATYVSQELVFDLALLTNLWTMFCFVAVQVIIPNMVCVAKIVVPFDRLTKLFSNIRPIVFITPQDMSGVRTGPQVRISKMVCWFSQFLPISS